MASSVACVDGDARESWLSLAEPWRRALELAWEAWQARTIPIGAVLADGSGRIVATGRNRVYEPDGPPLQLAHSLLAHAEVNALVGLDPERRYEDHVLTTSLEPCLLCLGATVMATVGTIRYLGADPLGGGHAFYDPERAGTQSPIAIEGPLGGPLGAFATSLVFAFFLRRRPEGRVITRFDERIPRLRQPAETLLDLDGSLPLASALERLWPQLSD